MQPTLLQSLGSNFLGAAPKWYKQTILFFLVLNPCLMFTAGPFVAGWALIAEFIFTLAMALKCYPLPAGGLLAFEAAFLGMTSTETIYHEALKNFEVILLLIFMVAGIYFMKEFLQFTFTRILVNVRLKDSYISAVLPCRGRFIRISRCADCNSCYYCGGVRILQCLSSICVRKIDAKRT